MTAAGTAFSQLQSVKCIHNLDSRSARVCVRARGKHTSSHVDVADYSVRVFKHCAISCHRHLSIRRIRRAQADIPIFETVDLHEKTSPSPPLSLPEIFVYVRLRSRLCVDFVRARSLDIHMDIDISSS